MKSPKKAQTQLQMARRAMRTFIKTKNEKAILEEKQRKAKAVLEGFAKANKKNFDESGNFKMPGGYLHFGKESTIQPCEGFDLRLFVADFPELVKQTLKTAAIKNFLESEGKDRLLKNHCVEVKEEDSFDVVVK